MGWAMMYFNPFILLPDTEHTINAPRSVNTLQEQKDVCTQCLPLLFLMLFF
jgi:hypothetical protein